MDALGELDYVAAQAYAAALIAGRCLELGPDDPLRAARRLRTTTFFGAFELDPGTGLERGHRLSVVTRFRRSEESAVSDCLAMPWFKVPIEGEGLERAWEALNRADIPTVGPTIHGRFTAEARVGRRMTAVLDADSAEEAEAHVEDNLPDGEYDIGPTEP